jgi:hypothetical protein
LRKYAIAGVWLNESATKVRSTLGSPSRAVHTAHAIEDFYGGGLVVWLVHPWTNPHIYRVQAVQTTSPLDAYSDGLRVGSSYTQLWSEVKPLSCSPPNNQVPTPASNPLPSPGTGTCVRFDGIYQTPAVGCNTYTTFSLVQFRITEIAIDVACGS